MKKFNNTYYILRHGQTIHQIKKKNVIYFWPEDKPPASLTKKGRHQIEIATKLLKNDKPDLIFASDALRTRQTSQIVAKKFGLKVNLDHRLREVNFGIYNGKNRAKFFQAFPNPIERFKKAPQKGESWNDVIKRLKSFLKEVEKKYKKKTILVVGHGEPLWLFGGMVRGLNEKELVKEYLEKSKPTLGELRGL